MCVTGYNREVTLSQCFGNIKEIAEVRTSVFNEQIFAVVYKNVRAWRKYYRRSLALWTDFAIIISRLDFFSLDRLLSKFEKQKLRSLRVTSRPVLRFCTTYVHGENRLSYFKFRILFWLTNRYVRYFNNQ